MITKEQAVNSRVGQLFYAINEKTGNIMQAKVNGKCQTWVTKPNEWRLPMKFGLYDYFNITQHSATNWTTDKSELEKKTQ